MLRSAVREGPWREAQTAPTASDGPSEFLRALKRGDPHAKAELFDRYVSMVERTLMRILGPDSELEDLVQESFVQALHSLHRFQGDASTLGPWLRAVAIRTARKKIRSRQVRRRVGLVDPEQFLHVPSSMDPRTQVALARAQQIITDLPDDQAAIFALRVLEGLELKEIADAVGLSLATVKRRLRSARETFEHEARRDPMLAEWTAPARGDA